MKKTRQNGFILIYVIVSIALIGAVMFVLTDDSNTMLFQSDRAYLRAVQRNLVASGLTWARHSIKSQRTEAFNKPAELDITNLNTRGSALTVTIDAPADRKPQVQIDTSCTRARRTLTSRDKYEINP
jgi:type II secretory pathway pseudopilin PulG